MNAPEIYGLILVGGYSRRMGMDKAALDFGSGVQVDKLYNLLAQECRKTYLSCRGDQKEKYQTNYPVIVDKISGKGPLGGILAALETHPEKAWLVLACDMPLVNTNSIRQLILERDPNNPSTAWESPHYGGPEPLFAIWEPSLYPHLITFWENDERSPRKFLIQQGYHKIIAQNPEILININTPEDLQKIESNFLKEHL